LPTKDGGVLAENNFLSTAPPAIGGVTSLPGGEGYKIVYWIASGTLQINVREPPFAERRQVAEQQLLGLLNIPPKEACRLRAKVGASGAAMYTTEPEITGRGFSLSFCR